MSPAGELAMWLAVGAAAVSVSVAVAPLVRALARRIEGAAAEQVEARLAALERHGQAIDEAELTRARLGELEERLDFAERMLAQPREPQRVPAAGET